MSDFEIGCERIKLAIEKAKISGKSVIFIEHLRGFGDILHSSIVVRHYKRVASNSIIVWGVSERYVNEFMTSVGTPDGADIMVGLPHGPEFPYDGELRVGWVNFAKSLGVRTITPSVHPWGWKTGRHIVKAILANAEISSLSVPLVPHLPVDISDYAWCDDFGRANNLKSWVTLEYMSNSVKPHDLEWYQNLVKLIKLPVMALGAANQPLPFNVIDCRGCTYRQAKVMIMRSKCFVGCASGNGMVAISDGVTTPIVEIVEFNLSMQNVGYINDIGRHKRRYRRLDLNVSAKDVANVINGFTNA